MEKKLLLGTLGSLSIFLLGAFAGCLGGGTVEHEVNNLLFAMEISGDGDTLTIEVILGNGDWDEYKIMVDDTTMLTTSAQTFGPSDEAVFTDPSSTWDPVSGTSYNVKVTEIGDDKLVYEDTIISKA
jgi:hypothetical protein